jgi:hypothetical protein
LSLARRSAVNQTPDGTLVALDSLRMAVEIGPWQKLNPATIELVPESPGLFEIGNLVRTVLFIGRANGNLKERLDALGAIPENVPASVGGYWVRWVAVDDEEAELAARQATHRDQHHGLLPAGNDARPKPVFRLVTRNAA